LTVNGNVPAGATGVPEITPVAGSKLRVDGSVPVPGRTMLKVNGSIPPTVWIGSLYDELILASGREVEVIASGGSMVKLRG